MSRIVECSYFSRRPKPTDDPDYLAFIRTLPCLICGNPAEPHHSAPKSTDQRGPDRGALPLCRKHHRRGFATSAHTLGKRFWRYHGISRMEEIARLNKMYEESYQEAA